MTKPNWEERWWEERWEEFIRFRYGHGDGLLISDKEIKSFISNLLIQARTETIKEVIERLKGMEPDAIQSPFGDDEQFVSKNRAIKIIQDL